MLTVVAQLIGALHCIAVGVTLIAGQGFYPAGGSSIEASLPSTAAAWSTCWQTNNLRISGN